jgi:hypothetical protein
VSGPRSCICGQIKLINLTSRNPRRLAATLVSHVGSVQGFSHFCQIGSTPGVQYEGCAGACHAACRRVLRYYIS